MLLNLGGEDDGEIHLEPFVDALAVELVATRENSHHLDFNQNHCDDH